MLRTRLRLRQLAGQPRLLRDSAWGWLALDTLTAQHLSQHRKRQQRSETMQRPLLRVQLQTCFSIVRAWPPCARRAMTATSAWRMTVHSCTLASCASTARMCLQAQCAPMWRSSTGSLGARMWRRVKWRAFVESSAALAAAACSGTLASAAPVKLLLLAALLQRLPPLAALGLLLLLQLLLPLALLRLLQRRLARRSARRAMQAHTAPSQPASSCTQVSCARTAPML